MWLDSICFCFVHFRAGNAVASDEFGQVIKEDLLDLCFRLPKGVNSVSCCFVELDGSGADKVQNRRNFILRETTTKALSASVEMRARSDFS